MSPSGPKAMPYTTKGMAMKVCKLPIDAVVLSFETSR
jgi:hypothetical protein